MKSVGNTGKESLLMHTLQIKNEKGVSVTPGMIGLFYEDINYCCDGGLNAEMLENPSFEFVEASGYFDHYTVRYDGLYGWSAFPFTGDDGRLAIRTDAPYHKNSPHYLRFYPSSSQNGAANKAFDGVLLKKGEQYKISAFLRSSEYTGKVTAAVYRSDSSLLEGVSYKDNHSPVSAVCLTETVTVDWVRYEAVFKADESIQNGIFVLETEKTESSESCKSESPAPCKSESPEPCKSESPAPCKSEPVYLEIDHVSLKPADAVHGIFRADIADLLKEMHPGFLRFPGGCVVEGNTLSNRYQWKKSVGPVWERSANWNRWAVHNNAHKEFFAGPYSHYNQTLAIGYYEYFLLCEYIGARPLPVQHVGLACQYQSTQRVEPDEPEFEEYISDVLDLIEFANGPADSKWGGLRASMGHAEPFGLELLGIGNEQWETADSRFFERYTRIEQAVHEKYPDIKLIGSAGPDVTSERYTAAWDFYKKKAGEQPNFTYAVDEHYYRPVDWLYENNHFYDDYPRNIKVFAGEYAAHVCSGMNRPDANTLDAALSEAAFLTGVERNADVVVLASYAPLLARVGYAQWSPDLIWFDEEICYGTPSYYVQKLYATNMGDYTLVSTLDAESRTNEKAEDELANEPSNDSGSLNENGCCLRNSGIKKGRRLYESVSYDSKTSEIIIKLVNPEETACEIGFQFDSAFVPARNAEAWILTHEDKDAYNHISEPVKVIPVRTSIDPLKPFPAPAHSFSVIRIRTEGKRNE